MKEIAKEFKAIFDPFYQAPIEVWEYFVQHGEVVEKQKKRYPKKIQRTSRRFLFYSQRFGRYFVIFK